MAPLKSLFKSLLIVDAFYCSCCCTKGLKPVEVVELCQGAQNSGPAECYVQSRNLGTIAQRTHLCNGAFNAVCSKNAPYRSSDIDHSVISSHLLELANLGSCSVLSARCECISQ